MLFNFYFFGWILLYRSLIVYPNGYRQDSGSGFISLYVAIDNSTLVEAHQEVFADLRFYVFKNNERKYFTIQDRKNMQYTHAWRYNIFKTMWGFSQVLPLATFRDPSNGYLYDEDHCEFGVDVTIHSPFQSSELFSVARNFDKPRFSWTIRSFSALVGDTYFSDTFSVGGRNWNIQVNPSGRATREGRALSMYLLLNANEKVRPYEKIYVRTKLRVVNQLIFSFFLGNHRKANQLPLLLCFSVCWTLNVASSFRTGLMSYVLVMVLRICLCLMLIFFDQLCLCLCLFCIFFLCLYNLHSPLVATQNSSSLSPCNNTKVVFSHFISLITLSNSYFKNPKIKTLHWRQTIRRLLNKSPSFHFLRSMAPAVGTVRGWILFSFLFHCHLLSPASQSIALSIYRQVLLVSVLCSLHSQSSCKMTSHYRNTISIVSLLCCLYITSASARSFIRQYTDDFNKNLQQENGAGPNPNVGEVNYVDKLQEISSRDYKVSASNAVKGLRDRPPSSYTLKMESFNTLLKSNYAERYESRPFAVGGYNWTLVVYPNGNKKDSGSGYLSLYVAIDNSTLVAAHQEVLADLRFYIFNNNERKYFTIQDTTVWRFNVFKTMWGFSQVLPVDTFKDPKNGYLYDGDHCEFGVDVIIPSIAENSELFSATEKFYNPTFTWTIRGFSTLLKDMYSSDVFTIGGRSWNIQVYPNGRGEGEGKFLSMFLKLNGEEKLRPYEKVYVRAKLRVLNQSKLNNVQNQLDSWFSRAVPSWGFRKLISFDDLRDSSKGFLVNDMLMVQVEMEAVSSTKYFP
ncbi:unnamed protein product [Brassica rapa subsp. narinosa]